MTTYRKIHTVTDYFRKIIHFAFLDKLCHKRAAEWLEKVGYYRFTITVCTSLREFMTLFLHLLFTCHIFAIHSITWPYIIFSHARIILQYEFHTWYDFFWDNSILLIIHNTRIYNKSILKYVLAKLLITWLALRLYTMDPISELPLYLLKNA